MKAKQLEVIKTKHETFMASGKESEPDDDCDLKVAIISGEPVKMKPTADIIKAVRHNLACSHYRSQVNLSDVFKAPANSKVAAWEKKEADRKKRVAAYRAKADGIVIRAELDDESDPQEVMASLVALAKQHGLYL